MTPLIKDLNMLENSELRKIIVRVMVNKLAASIFGQHDFRAGFAKLFFLAKRL